jgi:hypothetical protein
MRLVGMLSEGSDEICGHDQETLEEKVGKTDVGDDESFLKSVVSESL